MVERKKYYTGSETYVERFKRLIIVKRSVNLKTFNGHYANDHREKNKENKISEKVMSVALQIVYNLYIIRARETGVEQELFEEVWNNNFLKLMKSIKPSTQEVRYNYR